MDLVLHQNADTKPEIVETIQGEGLYMGTPAFFVRFQGCNVHCFFCDEKETWVKRENNSIEMNPSEIIAQLEEINPLLKRVVITGGEPTEQDLAPLIEALINKSYRVSIETAATGEFTSDLFQDYSEEIFVTFSPKEVYSKSSKIADERIWQRADELKFVIANDEGVEYLLTTIIVKLKQANNDCPIFLMPDWYNQDATKAKVLELCRQYPGRLRMGWQLHKLIDMP
jgi:7-carboxy-7-deazaguanine synthase